MAQPDNSGADYTPAERRTIQILKILKNETDEFHYVKQSGLLDIMLSSEDGATTTNSGTLSKSIDEILYQINPLEYTGENDDEYKIKYKGFESDLIKVKKEFKAGERNDLQKAPYITNLQYVHDLSYDELDKIIQAICLSSSISAEDKDKLVAKLCGISSRHYENPYYDKEIKKVVFNSKGIFNHNCDSALICRNLNVIQTAIKNDKQIRFMFNEYSKTGELKNRYKHTVSPFYIVIYEGVYFLICRKAGKDSISHYRIDLMTEVEVLKKDNELMPDDLPIRLLWKPEKYINEHLNMSYDVPRKIQIKIPANQYTFIHDYFGKDYTIITEGNDGDVIEVVSSPNMIVNWAMEYSDRVEILDEDIRIAIKEKLEKITRKYEK